MQNKVPILEGSGLVGTAAARSFVRAGWPVVAASWGHPELLKDANIEFVPMDLQDKEACAAACRKLKRVTRVGYTGVHELPGLVAGWSD